MVDGSAAAKARRAVNAKIVFILWTFVAFLYFYLSYDYIQVTMRDRQFTDYLDYVVQLAGNESRSAKDVRDLLLVKAEELSLPVRSEQIVVHGNGTALNIEVNYDVDIEIPWIQKQVYTKRFEHSLKYRSPR